MWIYRNRSADELALIVWAASFRLVLHVQLILANMLRAEFFRRAAKVLGILLDSVDVGAYCFRE